MRRTSPSVSVVIPARNEAANLRHVLPQLDQAYEIVVVDGHSVDDTMATARELRPDATVIQQTRKGKGNALACGFEAATKDVVVMFDADGSADPAEIPAFVAALAEADFAKGSRFAAGGGSEDITWLRHAGNSGLNMLANRLFGTAFTDLCYGYNAFWRDLVPVLELPDVDARQPDPDTMLWGDGFEIETVINCRFAAAGLRTAEVPSTELARIHGESNLRTFRDGSRVLRTLVAERRRAGQRKARLFRLDTEREVLTHRTELDQASAPDPVSVGAASADHSEERTG